MASVIKKKKKNETRKFEVLMRMQEEDVVLLADA
jgi:hypothetical protein